MKRAQIKVLRVYGILLTVMSLSFSLLACSHSSSHDKSPTRIACLGDSITYGFDLKERERTSYPAQLNLILGESFQVGNFGVNGATLLKKGGRPYMRQAAFRQAMEFHADIFIIKLGTNDLKPHNWKHNADFIDDYCSLISSIRSKFPESDIWICYPVPFFLEYPGIPKDLLETAVIPALETVSERMKVRVIDLYGPFRHKPALFPDKVHPNEQGARLMAQRVAGVLKKGGHR